jgi:hypothetical protein
MKDIGILETIRLNFIRRNCRLILLLEQALVEDSFSWLKCRIEHNKLIGIGTITLQGSCVKYLIEVYFSPLDYYCGRRIEQIRVLNPEIEFDSRIHMYIGKSLCLYYPDDLPLGKPPMLRQLLPWVSEWLVKYEFWLRFKVWIGNEVPH